MGAAYCAGSVSEPGRAPSADFYCALHEIANILLQLVQLIELNVFELLDSHTNFEFTANDAAGPQFNLLKARVQAMGLKGNPLLSRAASCVKQKEQRDEMIGIWCAFNKSLPIILMPPILADEAQRAAAAAGGVMVHMTFFPMVLRGDVYFSTRGEKRVSPDTRVRGWGPAG